MSSTDRIDRAVTDLHGISVELSSAIPVLIRKDWLALSPAHEKVEREMRDGREG